MERKGGGGRGEGGGREGEGRGKGGGREGEGGGKMRASFASGLSV